MPAGEAQTIKIAEAILATGTRSPRLPAEWEVGRLIDLCFNEGKALYVPKIQTADGIMDFVRVYSSADLTSLPSGTWGIPEPGDVWGDEKRACGTFHSWQILIDVVFDLICSARIFNRAIGYYTCARSVLAQYFSLPDTPDYHPLTNP